jgi:hypothetical protein
LPLAPARLRFVVVAAVVVAAVVIFIVVIVSVPSSGIPPPAWTGEVPPEDSVDPLPPDVVPERGQGLRIELGDGTLLCVVDL